MDGAVKGSASSPAVHAAWVDLLARLWLAEVACTSMTGRRQLQALGYRRGGTARRILAQERERAHRLARRLGQAPEETALLRRIGELARPQRLAALIGQVCEAYQQLQALYTADTAAHRRLAAWCEARRRVHVAQAEAMDAGATEAVGETRRAATEPAPRPA